MDERLTDEEIDAIAAPVVRSELLVTEWRGFARAIEAAVLARAAVPVVQPQEPVAWMAEDNTGYRGLTFIAPQTAEGAWDGFTITPLYAAPAPERARYPDSPAGEAAPPHSLPDMQADLQRWTELLEQQIKHRPIK